MLGEEGGEGSLRDSTRRCRVPDKVKQSWVLEGLTPRLPRKAVTEFETFTEKS